VRKTPFETPAAAHSARRGRFGAALRNEPWRIYPHIGEVGDRFDHGLEFVAQRGIREFDYSRVIAGVQRPVRCVLLTKDSFYKW